MPTFVLSAGTILIPDEYMPIFGTVVVFLFNLFLKTSFVKTMFYCVGFAAVYLIGSNILSPLFGYVSYSISHLAY
jgi:hypothetical protein